LFLDRILNSHEDAYSSIDQLEAEAELGENCYFQGISFSAKSALNAFLDSRDYRIERATHPILLTDSTALECFIDQKSHYGCVFFVPDSDGSLPSLVEEIILGCVLWNENIPEFNESTPYFVTQQEIDLDGNESFSIDYGSIPIRSLSSGSDSFFAINSTTVLDRSKFDWLDNDKISRVAMGGYPFYENKYGFLEFYRSIEVGHLSAILKELNSNFFRDASSALDNARNNISTDRNKFAAFASQVDVLAHFSDICAKLESFKVKGNSFAIALLANSKFSKTLKSKPRRINDQQWKGLALSYEIRCSIAHAGSVSIAVEDFDDADEVFCELNPILEKIIVECLGFGNAP
jgi:hypothetical protein